MQFSNAILKLKLRLKVNIFCVNDGRSLIDFQWRFESLFYSATLFYYSIEKIKFDYTIKKLNMTATLFINTLTYLLNKTPKRRTSE